MPVLKPISGHSTVRYTMLYLTKQNRAIASDYINLEPPETQQENERFDWAAVMDATRHTLGNDVPWRGMRVRTFKHYIVSPDPVDNIDLPALRELATTWANEHFAEYEVAIVYHDDNEGRIPHAHVVVNNTNLETGRRLQDPDPRALNHSLQRMAQQQGLRHFADTQELEGVTARAERMSTRVRPKTFQREYVRKAEREITEKGNYSWTADIRSRVRVARLVARSEAEFRSLLGAMDIAVADNSPKAERRDWIYSMKDHPTWRITGEKLGLSYGRERLLSTFAENGAGRLPDASERRIAAIAKEAVTLGSLEELRTLSKALSLAETHGITSRDALRRFGQGSYEKTAWTDPDAAEARQLAEFLDNAGILPEHDPQPAMRQPTARSKDASRRQGSRARTYGQAEREHDRPAERRYEPQQPRQGEER